MMLSVIPKNWFSWNFRVMEGTQQMAEIDLTWLREQGLLIIKNESYKVYREGLISGAFILKTAGAVVARAEKPNAFHRRFLIEHAGRSFNLQAQSAFGRGFDLYDSSKKIGFVVPENFLTRRAIVNFPDELPLSLKIFMIWLVIILWKRESDSGTSAT